MELYYSDQYQKSDFNRIEELKELKRYGQKSLETTAIIVLGGFYGVMNITSWFAQGYFTKLGELTAETNFKKYQDFKSKLSQILFKNKNPIFSIQLQHNDCLIRLFYKANNINEFKKQLDSTDKTYYKLIDFLNSKKRSIKMLTLSLKNSEITDFYYVDSNNNIYALSEELKKKDG